ncbi:aminotransferase class III-fold pyridoxal phosphate-dependent enzyme [Paenibacillus psychroresistens]|nr:aminotransferase class III-fold pyridoxal phosphate-dependent enzyme [Paenibacillus psychroresistens]
MTANWSFNNTDRSAVQQLEKFLPAKIYDIHAHIYRVSDLNLSKPNLWSSGPPDVSIPIWKEHISRFFPGKQVSGGLFFPAPTPMADLRGENEYLLEQLEQEPDSRGLVLVTPDFSQEELSAYLDHGQIVGFKPYHVYSSERPTNQSSIRGFFPEWMWKAANERSGIIMLHLVKDMAIADPANQAEIKEMCRRYPHAKLILAHAARCFHAPHAKAGIEALRGLDNVWFDMSGICEPEAIKTVLRQFGPRKLLWGSDFPISEIRGKSITIGDGFLWIDSNLCDMDKLGSAQPVLVGIESLRALHLAADDLGLNARDWNDIFYANAVRLLSLKEQPGNLLKELHLHSKSRLPGSVPHLGNKAGNMESSPWPIYFSEARGCEIWDMDGKHYYDISSNGIGSCLLGYRDADVTKAAVRRLEMGSIFNPPDEVELADLLCDIHPWAEQVRFVRGGEEAREASIRIACATTNHTVIAGCEYQGLSEECSFKYNDLQGLQAIIDQYGPKLAAVIMEPCQNGGLETDFLKQVREATSRCGALLIFDETSMGWRLNYGGAHLQHSVRPDMAIFGNTLGNGHPIGAIIGTKAAMEGVHGLFISRFESICSAEAAAALQKMGKIDVPAHAARIGGRVMESWRRNGEKHKVPINTSGYPSMAHFSFQHGEADKLRTLYMQMMLERGFLADMWIYPSLSHTEEIAEMYNKAIDEVFGEISSIIAL